MFSSAPTTTTLPSAQSLYVASDELLHRNPRAHDASPLHLTAKNRGVAQQPALVRENGVHPPGCGFDLGPPPFTKLFIHTSLY